MAEDNNKNNKFIHVASGNVVYAYRAGFAGECVSCKDGDGKFPDRDREGYGTRLEMYFDENYQAFDKNSVIFWE